MEANWRDQVNVPLLRKTLEHITEHPEEWEQGAWAMRNSCGTACCLAGTAVVLAGHKLQWEDCERGDYLDFANCVETDDPMLRDTDAVSIPVVAQRELNLPDFASTRLFSANNSLADLWALAEDVTGGAIVMSEETTAQHADECARRQKAARDGFTRWADRAQPS